MKKNIFVKIGIVLIVVLIVIATIGICFHIPLDLGEIVNESKTNTTEEILLKSISAVVRILMVVDAILNLVYAIYLKVKKQEKIATLILFSLILIIVMNIYVIMFTVA